MRQATVASALLLLLTGAVSAVNAGQAGDATDPILYVDGRPPARVLVTISAGPPTEPACESPMCLRAAGILADLDARGISRLLDCLPINPPPVAPEDAAASRDRLCVLHLVAASGARRRLDVIRSADASLMLRDIDNLASAPRSARLRADRFLELSASWPSFRGDLFLPVDPAMLGAAFELLRPYAESPITLDAATIKQRLHRSLDMKIEPVLRSLDDETFFLRLPANYSPRTPVGLVVWVDPTDSGLPPREFDAALDELGLACVGAADSGNARPSFERMQAALDALATVCRRYHVDEERVYIAGMSGGARIASIMWGAFPDVFAGAVPIVGLSSYLQVPAGRGPGAGANKVYPREYARPVGDLARLLRTRRLAVIDGKEDFNHEAVQAIARALARDGQNVRVFSCELMRHEMPTPERFAEALRWADEPRRNQRAESARRAAEQLENYVSRHGAGPPRTPRQREALVAVIELARWSEPAWSALDLLASP